MAADYSRVHRLLKIVTLIQGGGGWTPRRLSQECGTTERTIYRDLKMLEGAGIPYFYDEEKKTYAVRKDFFLPPVQLTLEESLALAALAEHVGGREQVPFTEAAARGIAKVRGQLPTAIRDELERIESTISIHLAAANPPEAAADVYAVVRFALSRRRALRCEYESIAGDGKKNNVQASAKDGIFLFNPYALFFGQRAWYAVGHHDGRHEVRCLKLTRFTRCELTDQTYTIPKDFSLNTHLGDAWRMIRGSKSHEVELEFDRTFAETIADTHWHRTQEVIWREDESIVFRCTVDGLDEIVWWVLSMGPHCVVRKPAELAGRVAEMAKQVYSLYREHADEGTPAAVPGDARTPRAKRRPR